MDKYASLIQIARTYLFVQDDGKFGGRWPSFFNKSIAGILDVPWCASYVGSCILENKERNGFLPQVALNAGVLNFWSENQVALKKLPQPGFVVCWRLSNTNEGHMGIVTGVHGQSISTIEGDTSPDKNEIDRTGHCVAEKIRPIGPLGSFELLGFIDPYWRRL
jgi:hypothetical protein